MQHLDLKTLGHLLGPAIHDWRDSVIIPNVFNAPNISTV